MPFNITENIKGNVYNFYGYVYVFSSKQYLRSIDTFIAAPSLLL